MCAFLRGEIQTSKIEVFGSPDVIIKSEASIGEGPIFDHRTGRLVWVDIAQGKIYENDLTSGDQKETTLDTMVGAVAPRNSKNGFAVAVAEGFGFVENGVLDLIDPVLPENYRRMNDAKVDSKGRLWAGSTHMIFLPGFGALHRWNGLEPSQQIAEDLILPNGMGWNLADSIFYLVDSFAHCLYATSYRSDEGEIGKLSVLAEINSGLPDGLAVDVDGFIWIAIWGGNEVRRFNSMGELVGIVPMPVAQPSSCIFGADGTLYITSARSGLSEVELQTQPLAGSVFAMNTRTQGVPVQPFGA